MTSADESSNAGAKAGNIITKGAAKLHGIGEALRGNINAFADSAVHTDPSKSQAVADRGEREFHAGKLEGHHGAGVTPVDTETEGAERVEREREMARAEMAERGVQGEGNKVAHGNGAGLNSLGSAAGLGAAPGGTV